MFDTPELEEDAASSGRLSSLGSAVSDTRGVQGEVGTGMRVVGHKGGWTEGQTAGDEGKVLLHPPV